MIDTLILSGGGPSAIAYFGIFKSLFDHNIIDENLTGIKEIITTSAGIFPSIFFIMHIPFDISYQLTLKWDFSNLIDNDSINIDNILVDFGLYDNSKLRNLYESIFQKFFHKNDFTLKELYDKYQIKLTVKVFNVTLKNLEYISYENEPDLSIIKLTQMTTAIPIFFKPVKYKDYLYVDGGLRGHFPIEHCKSKNYLGLFIAGGSISKHKDFLKLFPILEFLYSLMINQDQTVYDVKNGKINKNIIYVEVNYGLNFVMEIEKKKEIIQQAYEITTNHINQYLVKDKV